MRTTSTATAEEEDAARPGLPEAEVRRATEAIADRRGAEVTGGPTVHLVREDRGGAKAIPAIKGRPAIPAVKGRPATKAIQGRPAPKAQEDDEGRGHVRTMSHPE